MQSPQNIMSYKCAKFALAVVAAMIPFGWMVCARILYWPGSIKIFCNKYVNACFRVQVSYYRLFGHCLTWPHEE